MGTVIVPAKNRTAVELEEGVAAAQGLVGGPTTPS